MQRVRFGQHGESDAAHCGVFWRLMTPMQWRHIHFIHREDVPMI